MARLGGARHAGEAMSGAQTETNVGVATIFGLCALLVALTLFSVSYLIYDDEIGPHIYATLAGVFAEAALVVLVLDQISRNQERREWSFVRRAVGERIAAAMVDVMRLFVVRWSPMAYEANNARYDEFVTVAELHLADLRSNLQSLALGAEPRDYREARRIELRLAWLIRYLRVGTASPTHPDRELLFVVTETARLTKNFLHRESRYAPTLATAAQTVARTRVVDADAFFTARQEAQATVSQLEVGDSRSPSGIMFDVEGELALKYFAIDSSLLERV